MKNYLVFVFSLLLLMGCSEHSHTELQLDYTVILSDSLTKELLLAEDGMVKLSVKNVEKKCPKPFSIIYYNQEVRDTVWHVISTQCNYTDTIIDGIKFDQKELILDRIYYNNEKSTPEHISVDFLNELTWKNEVYYDVNMFEIDCQGQFIYLNQTSEFDREMRRLTKTKKHSGTYLSGVTDSYSRLELRDGTIEGTYAMLFQLKDSEGCIRLYSQLDKIVENDVIDLIPDTMTIKLSEELAVLTVEHLIICDTIANLKLNLEKSIQ